MTDTHSITIWVVTYEPETDNQFEEHWDNYIPTLTEEEAIEEVDSVLHGWNNFLRKGEHPREAISFTLEDVKDESS